LKKKFFLTLSKGDNNLLGSKKTTFSSRYGRASSDSCS
jgi:hypothetical protein